MDATRWQRLQQLFEAAGELPAESRRQWLHEACPDDPELARQAESLILNSERHTGIGDAIHDAASTFSLLPEPAPGDRFGAYRILRLLGRGGMGAVFLAERDDDQFRKTVAIKLIRSGLSTPETLARFKAERQILARLDHPNIARLLDAGAGADGIPYVVMEYVEGEPLTDYCNRRQLSIADRLRLFRKVCSAVHYSHQNLIVHRDLKPGNILVTGDAEPKLLDFGIAKLLDPAASPRTQTQARLMTPDYASPEQVRGEPVTTAADIYALGVLLFELLTGERPFRLPSTESFSLEQAICTLEPPRPSTLRAELRGDLDTIVLMALRKEPARRYASAEQFSDDLRRYLEGYPVSARHDQWSYRAARFLHRNRAATVAAAGFVAVLIASVVLVSMQARRAAVERDNAIAARAQAETARQAEQAQREQAQRNESRAETAEKDATRQAARAQAEAESARKAASFLADVFQGTDPFDLSVRPNSIRELVDHGARRLETELRNQPAVRASLQDVIGRVYLNLIVTDRAESLIREALATRRALFGDTHADVAASLHSLSLVLDRRSDLPNAEAAAREAVRIRRAVGPSPAELADSLENLSIVFQRKGDYPAAEKIQREALAIRQTTFGENDPRTGNAYNVLAGVLRLRGDFAGAEPLLRRALDIIVRSSGRNHPVVTNLTNNHATVLFQLGRYPQAEALFREALATSRARFGNEHTVVANAINNLATVLHQKRDYDEAESLFREALALNRKLVGEVHTQTADNLNNLGRVLLAKRDFDGAEPVLRQAIEVRRKAQGNDHPLVAVALDGLGLAHRERGDFAAAAPLHRESLEIRRRKLRAGHPALAVPLLGLAQIESHFHRPAEAEPLLREALALRRKALPAGHWEIAEIASVLGGCLTDLGQYAEAESLLLESYPALRKEQGDDSRIVRETYDRAIALYKASDQPLRAEAFTKPGATGAGRKPDR